MIAATLTFKEWPWTVTVGEHSTTTAEIVAVRVGTEHRAYTLVPPERGEYGEPAEYITPRQEPPEGWKLVRAWIAKREGEVDLAHEYLPRDEGGYGEHRARRNLVARLWSDE